MPKSKKQLKKGKKLDGFLIWNDKEGYFGSWFDNKKDAEFMAEGFNNINFRVEVIPVSISIKLTKPKKK